MDKNISFKEFVLKLYIERLKLAASRKLSTVTVTKKRESEL